MSQRKAIDNTHRQTWNREEFHKKAEEREQKEKTEDESKLDARKRKRLERDPLHQGIIIERAKLRPRDYQVDLTSNLKKSQVQSASMGISQQGGYYCEVCDCVLKDSLAYLDHINGKYHNRALGMSMEVERSTADQVRKRLELAKKKKSGEIPEETDYLPEGVNQKLLEYQNSKGEDSETEDSEGDSEKEEEEDEESNFAAMMGFGSFGGSKKNQ